MVELKFKNKMKNKSIHVQSLLKLYHMIANLKIEKNGTQWNKL